MTTDEKLAVIAKAILDLAEKAARFNGWSSEGQQEVATGIWLGLETEDALKEIARGGKR